MKRFNQLFKKCTNYMQNESENGSGSSRFGSLSILSRQSVLAIFCLLFLGVGNVWATETLNNVYMDWNFNGVQFYTINSNQSYGYASSDNRGDGVLYDLGVLTTKFEIRSIYWKVSTNWNPSCCNGWMKYQINGGEVQSMNYNSDCGSGDNQQIGGNFSPYHEVATSSGAPGVYYFVHWFEAYFCHESGGGSNKATLSNNSKNYKFQYTIPGFTTTSTSQTFVSALSSYKDETISFGQHYGTALTVVDNCEITGTDASLFSVQSISETGVTVRFSPGSSAGVKTATLTITDAHEKTCTITLTGKSKVTVTYNQGTNGGSGSEVTDDKVYGVDLTLKGSGFFTRTGYDQTAWNTNTAGSGGTEYSLNGTYTSESAITLYPTWDAHTYTVTLKPGLGGSGSDGSLTVDYDAAAINGDMSYSFSNSGYSLCGWYPSQGSDLKVLETNGTFAASSVEGYITNGKWSNASDCDLHAHWCANTYKITFDATTNGGSIINIGDTYEESSSHKIDATYGSIVSGTMPTARKDGYHFNGWYSAASGGLQIIDESGVWQANKSGYTDGSKNWKCASPTTLYAQYSNDISGVSFSPSSVLPSEEITVTTNFTDSKNPEGTYSFCYKLTTGAGIEMQVQPTFTNDGLSATFEAPGTPGTYSVEARLYAEASHDCATAGSPVASYTAHGTTFTVESTNAVTVMYKCGDVELRSSTTVQATASQRAVSVTAPTIDGLTFTGWTRGANVTRASGDNDNVNPISIYASAASTLTANYTQGPLFFKKPANWEHVYIYFYSITTYWRNPTDVDKREGTGSKSGWGITSGPIELTNIVEGTTDVYYYDLSTTPTCVVFSDLSMSDYEYFSTVNGTIPNIVRVTSFDSNNPMIVPTGSGTLRNQGAARYFDYDKVPLVTDWGWTVRCDVDGWVATHHLQSSKLGDLTFSSKIYLDKASHDYLWRLYASDGSTPYGKQSPTPVLTCSSPTSPTLVKNDGNLYVKTNIAGYYTFTATYGTGTTYLGNNITVTITYPLNEDDYRLLYDDDNLNPHPSSIIHKRNNGKDTVSMFYDPDNNPVMKMQQCSGISESAADGVDPTSWNSTTLDLSGFSTVLTEAGVYNFIVQQDANGANPTIINVEKYTGQFYIRTDCVNSDKWNYMDSKEEHIMHYSDYSLTLTTEPYSHYFTKWIEGSVGSQTKIKFTVATDYSESISDTLLGDAILGEGEPQVYNTNVRFMYNYNTNALSRAYTQGPTDPLYMILRTPYVAEEGENHAWIYKSWTDKDTYTRFSNPTTLDAVNVDTVRFDDMGNWVYQADVYARPNAPIKLTGNFSGTRYFKGTSGTSYSTTGGSPDAEKLIGGTGDPQHMRIVYDFKTNRMITSWLPPESAISGDYKLEADILLIREHQDPADAITFASGAGNMLENVKKVYGVMKFNKSTLNDPTYSRYERDLYWISFPFNVNLSDVFGFGEYGTHWIIERYDGIGRAKNGFWADSPSNWKFVTPYQRDSGWVLNANEGYILALDLDELDTESSVWDNSVSTGYLYFPSSTDIGTIKATSKTVNFTNQSEYKCNIGPRFDGGDDRRIKDSYWHCIGVPSFAGAGQSISSAGIDYGSIDRPEEWTANIPFVYRWNSTNNTLSVATGSSSMTFAAMYSYLVQFSGSSLSWTGVTNTPPSVASRLTETPDIEFQLALIREDEEQDHTYVRLTDDASVSNRFEFNYDLSKEYNAGRGNIWTVTADTVEVAGNSMPKPLQTTLVPVGVKVVANGEYTLSMPEGTNGEDVILIDNAYGTRTNLGLMPYTVTLTAGTYDSRFALEFGPIQDAPTSLENDGLSRSDELNDANDDVRKVFVGGRLYIIRDGKVYDAAGQRIE